MEGAEGTKRRDSALDPMEARRRLLAGGTVLAPSSLLALLVVQSVPAPAVFVSPLLWASLAGVWFGAFCLAYFFEVRALDQEARGREGLTLSGVRIVWVGTPLTRHRAGTGAIFRSTGAAYPEEFEMHLNLGPTWSLFVVGIESAWQMREDGVLLIGAHGTRFLAGATVESLSLPSIETAALRAVLEPGAARESLPEWGRPAGPLATEVLGELRPATWLIGPEQPYIAFEARDGRIEKWWPPPLDRLFALDPGTGLDLARIVRAFDRDGLTARGGAPTSSPLA